MIDQLDAIAQAEARSRAEDWPGALAGWQAVVATNPVNGAYWDRLAEARKATGDYVGALEAWQHAEALGVWPVRGNDPIPVQSIFPGEVAYQIARCHARLGEPELALEALRRAVDGQLRDLSRLSTDPDLASLREHPGFANLIAGLGGEQLPRIAGWQADLEFLCQEIRRRAPMPHLIDAAFEATARELHQAIPELDDVRIVVGMWRLLRHLRDGHAFVNAHPSFPELSSSVPVWFYQFAEGIFIPRVDQRYRHLLDAQVLAVDGRPVSEVIRALDPLLTRDNEHGARLHAPVWLRQPAYLHALDLADRPDQITLTLQLPDGEPTEVTLPAEAGDQPSPWPHHCPPTSVGPVPTADGEPLYLRAVDTHYWYEYLPAGNLLYFQFNALSDQPDEPLFGFYQRMFAEVDQHGATAMAIDLRWNPGGNTLLAYPLIHHLIRHDRINQRGKLFVITGRNTFSAAQNTATLLEWYTNATFIGEPTGSSPNFIGETTPFRLPHSGVRVNVSDLYWQTSWPFDRRTAIAPELYAPPTFAAWRAGRDPALEAILSCLRQVGPPAPVR